MYNRYDGNSGRVRRVEDPPPHPPAFAPPHGPPPPDFGPPAGPPPPEGPPRPPEKDGLPWPHLPERLFGLRLETEDILLLLILYLLYRETGDTEFLLILGGVLLL